MTTFEHFARRAFLNSSYFVFRSAVSSAASLVRDCGELFQ
jgi:hypothetical protein